MTLATCGRVLLLAAAGGIAQGASAQTPGLYLGGAVDLAVRYVSNDQSTWQLADGGMATSRLVFAGYEDLGGGFGAGFWLEGGIGADTGTLPVSFGNGFGSFAFLRRSTVGLRTPWGVLRLGRDYTPGFWNVTVFDPFGTSGVGSAGNLFVSAEIRGIAGADAAYATLARANNTVGYISPNGQFGPGLYGQLMVAAGEGASANKYLGGRIGYAKEPYNAAVAYSRTDVDVSGAVTLSTFNVGGSWNFGWVKLSGFYGNLQLVGLAAGDASQTNGYVGATAPWGQWNGKVSYGYVRQGGVVAGNSARQIAAGVDYNLSKRTALYATYSSIANDNTAYGVSASGSRLTRGTNSSGAELGIRHFF